MQSIFLPYNQYLSYPDIINLLSFFLISDAKVRAFVFAYKYFRRKVSEHPDFLIKVKNLYISVTEEGDIFKAFALCLRPVTVGSGRTDKSEGAFR